MTPGRFVYDHGVRPQTQPDGTIVQRRLAWCVCGAPDGPRGGVCATCQGAIYQPPVGERAVEQPTKETS
jgi:hypothetical protein